MFYSSRKHSTIIIKLFHKWGAFIGNSCISWLDHFRARLCHKANHFDYDLVGKNVYLDMAKRALNEQCIVYVPSNVHCVTMLCATLKCLNALIDWELQWVFQKMFVMWYCESQIFEFSIVGNVNLIFPGITVQHSTESFLSVLLDSIPI